MPVVYICDNCGKQKGNGCAYEEGRWEVIPTIVGGSRKVLCPDCKEKDVLFLAEKRRSHRINMAIELFRQGLEQKIAIQEVMEDIKKELAAKEIVKGMLEKSRAHHNKS